MTGYSKELLERLDEMEAPSDPLLEKSMEGKIARFSGEIKGKADRLHRSPYNPPKGSDNPKKWSLETLEFNAYDKEFFAPRFHKI
jgi:hypothetical protein